MKMAGVGKASAGPAVIEESGPGRPKRIKTKSIPQPKPPKPQKLAIPGATKKERKDVY